MDFDHYDEVSINVDKETLRAKFNGINYFRSVEGPVLSASVAETEKLLPP